MKQCNSNNRGFSSSYPISCPSCCNYFQVLDLNLSILSHLEWLVRQSALLHVFTLFLPHFIYFMQSELFHFPWTRIVCMALTKPAKGWSLQRFNSKVRFKKCSKNLFDLYISDQLQFFSMKSLCQKDRLDNLKIS